MSEPSVKALALPAAPTPEQYPRVYVAGGLDVFYQQVREQVLSEVPDLNSKAGIARVKSLAAMVSSSKTAIEKPGRDYLRQIKDLPRQVEAELRCFVDKMDALRDEVRKPVTDMEQRERARVAALESRLELLCQCGNLTPGKPLSSAAVREKLEAIRLTSIDDSWCEYRERAQAVKDLAEQTLSGALHEAEAREAQQAELEQLRAERAELERLRAEVAAGLPVPPDNAAPMPSLVPVSNADAAPDFRAMNRRIAEAMMTRAGISESQAKDLIKSILRQQIPFTHITY